MANLRIQLGVQNGQNVFCDYILNFPYFWHTAYTFLVESYNRLFIVKTRQQ